MATVVGQTLNGEPVRSVSIRSRLCVSWLMDRSTVWDYRQI